MLSEKGMFKVIGVVSLSLLVSIVISNCANKTKYIGSPIQGNPDDIIEVNVTNFEQILYAFGPPDEIKEQHDGYIVIYKYIREKNHYFKLKVFLITGERLATFDFKRVKYDLLTILFNPQGTVIGYGCNKR